MKADQIGLQLYTVRDQTKNDMLGTLRKLGGMGLKAVELAGYGNSSAQEVRAALDDLGMRAVASHIGLNRFTDEAAAVFSELDTLGCRYAVLPSVPENRRQTADEARRLVEQINELAQRCRDEGFQFAYHNHSFEFAPLEGSDFYTILTAGTDPSLVKLELDIYWAKYAGLDPVELIGRFGSRVALLHMKDMLANEARDMAAVGAGVMPWADILQAADAAGVEWYIIEHDRPDDALADSEQGLRYLESVAK